MTHLLIGYIVLVCSYGALGLRLQHGVTTMPVHAFKLVQLHSIFCREHLHIYTHALDVCPMQQLACICGYVCVCVCVVVCVCVWLCVCVVVCVCVCVSSTQARASACMGVNTSY